jgi:hypothetical protein
MPHQQPLEMEFVALVMKIKDILVKFKVEVLRLFFTGEQSIGVHEPVHPFRVGVDVVCW